MISIIFAEEGTWGIYFFVDCPLLCGYCTHMMNHLHTEGAKKLQVSSKLEIVDMDTSTALPALNQGLCRSRDRPASQAFPWSVDGWNYFLFDYFGFLS